MSRIRHPAPVLLLGFLLGLLLPALARADLNLPERTIVVRDFARRQQDLLDTLRVNVPDATIEITQFRGAEVVLQLTLESPDPLEDAERAESRLRRHCDHLIRRAFPGMRLSPESLFLLRGPEELARTRGKDLVTRLRGALSQITGHDLGSPEGAEDAAAPPADSLAAGMPPDSVDTGAEHRYRQLLAEKRAEARAKVREAMAPPPAVPAPEPASSPLASPPVPAVPLLSPETAQAMARFPAQPVPEPSGQTRETLARMATQRNLLDRLKRARGVSATTIAELERFQETGGGPVDSSETVRRIYAQIFEDRRRAAEPSEAVVQLAAPVLTASSEGTPPAAAAPTATREPPIGEAAEVPDPELTWDDGAFGKELENLFEPSKRKPQGAPLGLSMVGLPAPRAGKTEPKESR